MSKCELCGRKVGGNREYHDKCRITAYQLEEIIEIYRNNEEVPQWLSNAVAEFAFVYEENMREKAVFKSAGEIAEEFVISGKEKLRRDNIDYMIRSRRPNKEILRTLEEGMIIELKNGKIFPGEMIGQCRKIADRGIELNEPESKKARQEMFGFLAIALTWSLVTQDRKYKPRYALSIPKIITEQIRGAREGEDELISIRFQNATKELKKYQRDKLMERMAGWVPSGDNRIIKDISFDGTPLLKDCMVEYTDRMRERLRERMRKERERG